MKYLPFALFNITLGLATGYWLAGLKSGSSSSNGINTTTTNELGPEPSALQQIMRTRHDVPFSPNYHYMGPSAEVKANWMALTKSQDSIYLSNPHAFNIQDAGIRAPFFTFIDPPPAAAKAPNLLNFYVLSNLHQLHCTHMIRTRYNELVYDKIDPFKDTSFDRNWITHVEHCFEYLRLSITCGDNMVFESDSPPGSPKEFWEDGLSWGVVHSCMDWEGLMEWQEQQLVLYNSTWS
ncbi:uncharacterized protein SEPMUDRAFT_45138 [Sphaerulina musiva SO2202]|uniref:Oxidase ustYa n=1 Tax=Sphaerulina musiva (strain SO2202) TaxID=692275 RepID=M3D490_SPHMS|nr:uncharacterized protein SEPMUDRAFT_45138 [Sphaerulina musiva SO2202]EMF12709.1 hypothetical protein SEPMUDRAFT_45138 [Sphaerulina musiva SO2202]